ncbi:DNA cytosine methyltransferase [Marinomonas sp. C2222]|uniref:DNA (cytosine-5-)-methyltransferase n=1 Tax=Marinomonas sargassi TaxID=2984494 RepID=A0ABT2YQD7_9GAMM|nr:DNA cytosine methyltransferase [Marinomonas sargassi]MCV2402099.1 DNA cytosine methyltransferase [Marinomonas sargassi]
MSIELRGSDYNFLRETKSKFDEVLTSNSHIRIVDLFSGCGGTSLGAVEAIRTKGLTATISAAVEWDKVTAECFKENFSPDTMLNTDITTLLDGRAGEQLTESERKFQDTCGHVDILLGGPPCQGHSSLNNYSRMNDPKNALYFKMARAAEVLKPEFIFIENVVGAVNDRSGVVQRTIERLQDLGYLISKGVIDCKELGLAQSRKRFILMASKGKSIPSTDSILKKYSLEPKSLSWAIGDLIGSAKSGDIFNEPSKPSKENLERINYLFESNLYDLPNEMRPPCHRDKKHSYNSIYGRLSWDKPSQTLTGGFYNMSMGRYIHPEEKRTLTAHEAARIQGFPDFFNFYPALKRTSLAQIIGNAVPPKLAFSCVMELIEND